MYCNRCKVVKMTTTFILSLSLLIALWTFPIDFSSYARCPNGYHKSPSGDCEKVVKSSTKLPRCPNGFHRSPGGVCEAITSSSTKQSRCLNGSHKSPSGDCENILGDTSTGSSSNSESISSNPNQNPFI